MAEIESIQDAVADARSGHGRVLLFAGEPGIGKTTLARMAAAHAQESGMAGYWGFCWEAGGAPAYWPWTQLLRSLVAERDIPAKEIRPLARILPEVSATDGPELAPDQARFLLLESVRSLLSSVASETPLLLILDDLHASDDDSLSLLHYLARHAASLPLLIVGTYREIEARFSSDKQALWRTARDATVLRLARLGEDDIRKFLALKGDHSPGDEAVSRLLRTTSGNPLFLAELVGLLARDAGRDATPLPDSVQQVIRQQLALLPSECREVLASGSVVGREFGAPEVARLRSESEADVVAALGPALDAGFIRALERGGYRFVHTLYRDVLYHDIAAADRSLAHLNFAAQLRELIDSGDVDRWAALARHLQLAGPDHRLDVIDALRKAAARANERLAFRDAAELLHKAVVAFGQGPGYEPAERCRLLVEYATALLAAGDFDEGQSHCKEAFDIARMLGDAKLMSEVALAWGSVIIVARIDQRLIAALEDCLARLPEEDAATRSIVQARLAGALQPAPDPAVPMDMAREAIALARTTDDADVLYNVLRFGLSALVDFAPPAERIELNREYGRMAAARNDVPQQFRSNLLMMIDASEIGDRSLLDGAIAACDELASRVGLPHYQWRAASARAMQATIDGQFERASGFLDAAESFAGQAEDMQATITLSIQRFAQLVEWDSPRATPLQDIEADLDMAYASGLRDAEFFIAPLLALNKEDPDGRNAREFVENRRFVERTFAGSDRYSLTGLGLMALRAGKPELAQRCFDELLSFDDSCATLGLMGSCWCGPVAYSLGIIAHGLGRHDDASMYFDRALEIAAAMNARPYVARIHSSAAALARDTGDDTAARRHQADADKIIRELGMRPLRVAPSGVSAVPPATRRFSLQQQGDVWNVAFGGQSAVVRDTKGLQILARLIGHPDAEIHVLDLSGISRAAADSDEGPMLDPQARDEYRRRVTELQEELEDAESMADLGRADALRSELDFITRELSRAFGLGGRSRASGDAAERARVNVRRRIKDAVDRIGEQLPEAGKYLENTIKTGKYCRYSPM
jgi:tetratricopeptide (TPR) repeat protein